MSFSNEEIIEEILHTYWSENINMQEFFYEVNTFSERNPNTPREDVLKSAVEKIKNKKT